MFGHAQTIKTNETLNISTNQSAVGIDVVKTNSTSENFSTLLNASEIKNMTERIMKDYVVKEFLSIITKSFFVGDWKNVNNSNVSI